MWYPFAMGTLLEIGPELVRRRRALGLTQRALGERVGVRQPQIARWEANEYRSASLENVSAVAVALGVRPGMHATPIAAEHRAPYTALPQGAHPEAIAALAAIGVEPTPLVAFARSHGIARLELFGSVLGADFGPGSDVDILVDYAPDRAPTLMGIVDHEIELGAILGRRVDLVTRSAVERSANGLRRRRILDSARTVYATG